MSHNNMPKIAPDIEKLKKIRDLLKKHPEGIWIREIAKKLNFDKSLVSRYINKYIKNEIIDVYKIKKPFRVIKLK